MHMLLGSHADRTACGK